MVKFDNHGITTIWQEEGEDDEQCRKLHLYFPYHACAIMTHEPCGGANIQHLYITARKLLK